MGKTLLARAARRPLAALFLLCFVAWLPGLFTLPPLDRDESRFAQATKQMIESGDFVDIRFGARVRYEKPAGIYWLQAASTAVLGEGARNQIWTYRLPSLIGAFAAVALTFWLARAFVGAEAAFAGAALLGMTVLLVAEAKIAKTDAVLLATIVAAQGVLLRAYLSARVKSPPPSLGLALAGWAALGLGVLIKGPVIVLVCLATVIAVSLWDREWRWLKHTRALYGIALALAIVLPWAIAIGVESHGVFYQAALGKDFAGKLMGGEETHGAPPGYFLALVGFTFWPAALLLIPGIISGIKVRTEPALRYLLAWAGVVWLMFEIAPTKLPHYILPAYPALAILAALWLMRDGEAAKWERIGQSISLALFVLVGLFYAGFVAFAPNHFGFGSVWWLHAGAAVGAGAVIAVAVLILRGQRIEGMLTAVLAALVLYTFAGLGTVPRLQRLWLSPRLNDAVQEHRQAGDPPLIISGYTEPSLVFLLGTQTRIANGKDAADIAAAEGGLALVERKQQSPFLDELRARNAEAQAVGEISGINYSRWAATEVTLYRVKPAGGRS
jgi:Dolichyl-phosphate-mannose-protein mannosyltransferase